MEVSKNANLILRNLRLSKGWTQVELAKRMGLRTSQHLANIEYGTNRLTLEIAFNAAKALNVSVDVFLNDKVKRYVKLNKQGVTE